MRLLLPIVLLAATLLALNLRRPAIDAPVSVRGGSSSPEHGSNGAQAESRSYRTAVARSGITIHPSAEVGVNTGNAPAAADGSGGDSEMGESDARFDADGIPRALEELAARYSTKDDALRYRLMERWAADHPEALAKWAAGLAADQGRGRVLSQALLIWATSDVEAAIAFAQAEPTPATRSELLLGLAHESLHHDARRGLELAADLSATPERDELLEKGVMEWAGADSAQATHWVGQVTDAVLREKLMAAAAIGMAETRSFEAASLAAKSIQSVEDRDRAVVSILQRWVQTEPISALEWLGRFPEGDLKRFATRSTLATWEAMDPEAARAWVHALPPSPMKQWASLAIHP